MAFRNSAGALYAFVGNRQNFWYDYINQKEGNMPSCMQFPRDPKDLTPAQVELIRQRGQALREAQRKYEEAKKVSQASLKWEVTV